MPFPRGVAFDVRIFQRGEPLSSPFLKGGPRGISVVAENLVPRARSEKIGYPVILHSGMLEYWSVGMMGLLAWDLILSGWHGPEYKISRSSVFDTQFSIIPSFHHSTRSLRQKALLWGEIKALFSGLGSLLSPLSKGELKGILSPECFIQHH